MLTSARTPKGPAFSDRERRWVWVTELPVLACGLAAALWLDPQRELHPLICVAFVIAMAVASHVRIVLPDRGYAPSTQLIFVPMLLLAPLNLVLILVLAGNVIDCLVYNLSEHQPLGRTLLGLGNSADALAPVLVIALADPGPLAWADWPLYVAAIAAQLVSNSVLAIARVRLHVGIGVTRDALIAPAVIDVILTVPALGVVAIAADAPVAAVLITGALLAIASGFTSERGHRLAERERAALEAQRAILDERVRIARELHDVVAHHVSVIGVQAGAARLVLGRDPDKATETLSLIESASRQAVRELHQLLGFLRRAGDAESLGPQLGLGQVHDLAAAMSDSQLAVEVHVEGEPYALAPTVDASAYRIVQEALTNTLKHSGAARAEVRVRYGAGELELEIVDDGTGGGTPSRPGGLGLIGMRERVTLHGGDLVAGPKAGGGFVVRATLPGPR